MRSYLKLVTAAVAAILIMLAGVVGPASAATQGSRARFAAQALTAGLTTAQVKALQGEVDAYIKKDGGTQVAINKVDFHGGNIVFVVPGERYARVVTASSSGQAIPAASSACPYLYFCEWSGTNYTGSERSLLTCGTFYGNPFFGTGSWKNNQTSGTRARFYSSGVNLIFITPGAWSGDTSYNWNPVYFIEPCQ